MLRRLLLTAALIGAVSLGTVAVLAWFYVPGLERTVVEKFEGQRWAFPSRVYSDSFFIYPGLDLQASGVYERLQRLNYRQVDSLPLRKGDYRCTETSLTIYLHDFPYPGQVAPDRLIEMQLDHGVVKRISDGNSGEDIFSVQLEPEMITGLYDTAWEERREVSLAEVPPRLIQAILVTEDQRFYQHHGVDPVGILRALWVDLIHRRIVQGGSTLTQQLIKNFFLTEDRTWRRKITEAAMALIAEHLYSKNQILENYLNEIYLGQRGLQGIFGIWEASQLYFARKPSELSLAECALLAGMIRAPNTYSPFRNPQLARYRRDVVLGLLLQAGTITQSEYDAAVAEPLRIVPVRSVRNSAPYFVDFLRKELAEAYPHEVLTSEGLGIFTTLDVQMEQQAVRAVREGLTQLEKSYPRLKSDDPTQAVEACLIAVQPQTGEIKAMVGGRDYALTQLNRVVQSKRQPGSVFKPFVYLAAFEESKTWPHPITPETKLLDEPFEWDYDSQVWTPSNYRDHYLGEVTVRRALELSLNSATARLAHEIGLQPILDLARSMGITTDLPPYPSVILGGVEVSPLEIAQAYAVIANQGLRANLRSAKKVLDRQGEPIERNPLQVVRVASPQSTYLVTHLLEGVIQRGTGSAARSLGFTRPAAGKTGTTNEDNDAWFAGFTPDLLTVVWVGFDQTRKLGLTGAAAALPIWTRFMKEATAGRPPSAFVPPAGVALVRIDPYTGGLATPNCPDVIEEAFLRGEEPTEPCPVHGASASSHPIDVVPATPAAP
jgi:penicillin-binding protein 1B